MRNNTRVQRTLRLCMFACLLLTALPVSLWAQAVINWVGGIDDDWNDARNWNIGVVPGNTDSVEVVLDGMNDPVINADAIVRNFTLSGAGTMTVEAQLLVQGNFSNPSSNTTLAINGDFTVLGTSTISGTIDVNVAATFLSSVSIEGGTLIAGMGATTVMFGDNVSTSGSWALNLNSSVQLRSNLSLTNTGTVTSTGTATALEFTGTADQNFTTGDRTGLPSVRHIGSGNLTVDGNLDIDTNSITARGGSGATIFNGTVTANSITQEDTAGDITLRENVTLSGGPNIFSENIILDGLTLDSMGVLILGNNTMVMLSGGAVTINTTQQLTLLANVTGAQNLTLNVSGMSRFTGNVTVGAATGTGITINSGGNTSFERGLSIGTLGTSTGASIVQADTAGEVTFQGAINLNGSGESVLNADVQLSRATVTTAGNLIFGSDSTDTLTVEDGHAVINAATGTTPNITFNSAVEHSGTSGEHNLTINVGTAATTGAGSTITASAIGTDAARFNEVQLTAERIILQGGVFSDSDQRYTTAHGTGNDGGTFLQFANAGTISTMDTGSLVFNDLYISTDMSTNIITIEDISGDLVTSDRFTFYRGTLDIEGLTLRTSDDFVVFGSEYDINDTERPVANEWEYIDFPALRNAPVGSYSAQFQNLQGSSIEVTGNTSNFYVNGANLNPTSAWTLTLPANTNENPSYIPASGTGDEQWGIPYAVVLNSNIANSTVASNTIIAANTVTAGTVPTPAGTVSVMDGGGNTTYADRDLDDPAPPDSPRTMNMYNSISRTDLIESYGYDFTRTSIESAATVKSNLIRITFNKPILNANNEICTAADLVQIGNTGVGGVNINIEEDGSFLDGDTRALNQTLSTGCDPGTSSYYALRTFYLRVPSTGSEGGSWRTDAVGSMHADAVDLNSGLGGSNSSDEMGRREGVRGYGNIIPDIQFSKGLFRGSNGADFVIADGTNNDDTYSLTSDDTGPVLYEIQVGRADSSEPETDNHNYFRLMYSEPVAFGDTDGAGTPNAQTGLRHDDSGTFLSADSEQSFAGDGHGGGEIRNSPASPGTIEVTGLFSYTNSGYAANTDYHMRKGSRNSDPDIDLLRKPSPESLEIYLAARRESDNWIGWVFNVLDPYAAANDSLIVLPNLGVTDKNGNSIDNIESQASIRSNDNTIILPAGGSQISDFTPDRNSTIDFWDVSSPGISSRRAEDNTELSEFRPDRQVSATSYEIIPIDSNDDRLFDRISFFIHDNVLNRPWDFAQGEDNVQMQEIWDPDNNINSVPGHSSLRLVADTNGDLVTVPRGIRDSTVNISGFRAGVREQSISEAVNVTSISSTFSTQVETSFFNSIPPNTINEANDSYFTIEFSEDTANWDTETQIFITYNASEGLITDLAGNLMPSSGYEQETIFVNPLHPNRFAQNPYSDSMNESGKLFGIELIPPEITLALAAVGGRRIYLRFNEPVYASRTADDVISRNQFIFSKAGISSVLYISGTDDPITPGVTELYLLLENPLTPEMVLNGTIQRSDIIADAEGNVMGLEERNISDVLIGVVNPVWASDGIQSNERRGFSALREFDGTGSLSDFDITVESSILTDESALLSLPLNLYFDANVPDSQKTTDGFWSVIELPELIENVNRDARRAQIIQRSDTGNISQHRIPSGDSEIVNGQSLEFIYTLGDRVAAFTDDPDRPDRIDAWSFNIGGIIEQRGSATILNNVINPTAGDQTILDYSIDRAGVVVINVFTLDGDLVRVLNRSRLSAGRYTQVWDGRNNGGSTVAPGFYILRVLGPNIDESRKVLVVR